VARQYAAAVAHYLFNVVQGGGANASAQEQAAAFMRAAMWSVENSERHRVSLAPGDLVLLYLGAPDMMFVGRAELASAAHDWSASEAEACPGTAAGGVLLAHVEAWDPPVPMSDVLSQMDPVEKAKADFDAGVVRITEGEYATALAVAAQRHRATG